LQSFFEDTILGSLLCDNPLSKQLPVHLPEFHIFKANDTTRLAHDSQFSYDLDRAVNTTKADSKVFHSLAETLWRDAMYTNKYISDYPTPDFYTNWTPTATNTNFIFSVVALIAIIFLFYRVQLLATTIATMQITVHRTAVTSPTIPTILSYFSPTTPANVTISTQLPQFLKVIELNSTSPYLFLLCIILLLLLIYKKYRHCKSNPNSCSLILEFGNSTKTLQIRCQTLPGSPTQYTFSASELIKSVVITGRFKKSITVSWPSLRIHNNYLQMTFDFNNHISFCRLTNYELLR